MEPHVKERIVGAAVLVALGVWLIPWILDGPDVVVDEVEPETDRINLPATDDVAPIRTETVELSPSEPTREPEVVEADPIPDEVSAARTEPVIQESEQPEESAESQLAGLDTAVDEEEPVDETVAESAAPPPVEPVSAPVSGGWMVQLGAFSNEANAEQVVRRVATYGYDALISEVQSSGGILHRVRVSGFSSENAAEAAASALSAHGFNVRVTPPE